MIGGASPAGWLTASLALLTLGCSAAEIDSQVGAGASASSDDSASGTVTSIRNAGAIAELGAVDAGARIAVKFLFDPLYDNHFGSLAALDDALIEAIVSGAPPYDQVDAVFVSHAHGDHFSPKYLSQLMKAQRDVQLVAPAPAIAAMRDHPLWEDGFAERLTEVTLENGQEAVTFEIAGTQVQALRTPHAGWPERHSTVHNISYRVSGVGNSGQSVRVMHMGDADPSREHFAPHLDFFASQRTGVALVPFWFFDEDDADDLIDQTLNSESAVGIHVPATVPQRLQDSGREYFSGAGQRIDIPETD